VADNIQPGLLARLGQHWQLPMLLLSGLMLVVGWALVAQPEEQVNPWPGAIDQVARLISASQYDRALEQLADIKPYEQRMSRELQGEYHVLRADALYLGAPDGKPTDLERCREIVGHYDRAKQLGRVLDRARLTRMAECLVSLYQFARVKQLLPELGEAGSEARQRLWQRMIELTGRLPDRGLDQQLALIQQFLTEPDLTRASRIWATARQAEILLAQGQTESAINMLLRRLARLQVEGARDLGELKVHLGKAYVQVADFAAAERWFLAARDELPADNPLNGDALVGLGRIRLSEGNVIEALEHFDDAARHYPTTPSHLQALVGKAECEARLNAVAEAMEDYTEAVKLVRSAGPGRLGDRELLMQSLEAQREWRIERGEYQTALKLLTLEQQLFGDPYPPPLLQKLAMTHEQMAEQVLAEEGADESGGAQLDLTPKQRGKISYHFEKAADYFSAHAQAVTIGDDKLYGESLFRAGDCYDRAGLHRSAIERFAEFIEQRPNDPKRLEVSRRLGQAYQADGQYDLAIAQYDELIQKHPKTQEAYASHVPLAQCFLAKGADYWHKAEHLLTSVINDHEGLRPESAEYRQALIELGTLYYRRGEEGDYARAIEYLEIAVERYKDEPSRPEMLFQLGDAYRKSAAEFDKDLSGPLPPSQREAFRSERARRLAEAQRCFDEVIVTYEAKPPGQLDELAELYLRNAYFYRADCAYHLGRYEGPDGAISLYEKAVQKYEEDPVVLVALVQIVNCWCELGNFDEARSVNNRAKWYLSRIPDEAFDDPSLPMSREHWQRWLDWMSELNTMETTANAEGS
jgi:tetratricopeptide (TPR) repeat protein